MHVSTVLEAREGARSHGAGVTGPWELLDVGAGMWLRSSGRAHLSTGQLLSPLVLSLRMCAFCHGVQVEIRGLLAVIFLCHVSPGTSSQVLRLGSKYLHLLSCFTSPDHKRKKTLKKDLHFLNVCVLCACLVPVGHRRGYWIPQNWGSNGCELPYMCWETSLGLLQDSKSPYSLHHLSSLGFEAVSHVA